MFSYFRKINFTGLNILFYCLVIISFSSCVSQKKLIYLQDGGKKSPGKQYEFVKAENKEDEIQPGDELYIRVTSSDERPTNFNAEQFFSMGDITVLSYTVDERGYVKLPYIGELNLSNFTLQEAAKSIESLLTQYLYLPSVSIKFVNKNITILGEVANPGVYTFYSKYINVLQAIGYAGDITTFGNRKEILLIREENGIIKKNYIDLTKNDVFTSNLYIVKPNDIIYVQPLGRKKWGMETYPLYLAFSMITTIMMILTYLRYPLY